MPRISVSIDGATVKEFDITKERTTVGRRPYNDIVIENLAVSGEHAALIMRGNAVEIEDLNSTNGTYVNGKAVKTQRLQDNDWIEIGRYRMKFISQEAPATAAPAATSSVEGFAPPAPAKIQVLSGPAAGKEMALTKVVTTLGKPGVSIAAITQRSHGYTIARVDGATPPTVNGQPVDTSPLPLQHNDLIDLAGTQMRFVLS